MPAISIITINLNNSKGLELSCQSVISQTFDDYEYIIIDGGSSDNSINVINKYNRNLKYWSSEKDSGIYNAMNKGIEKANGDYILFLNSGDRFANTDVLKEAISLDMKEDIIYGEQLVEIQGALQQTVFLEPQYITFNSFMNNSLPHQCTFIRRELFSIIGLYNEENMIVSDWEWNCIALFRYNCSLRKIHIPIAVFDTNGISCDQKILEKHHREKRESAFRNFPRIMEDTDEYFKLLKRYKKLPRSISWLFNKIK